MCSVNTKWRKLNLFSIKPPSVWDLGLGNNKFKKSNVFRNDFTAHRNLQQHTKINTCNVWSKVQLISKCIFSFLASSILSKNERKKSSLILYYGTSSRNFFVRFLGEQNSYHTCWNISLPWMKYYGRELVKFINSEVLQMWQAIRNKRSAMLIDFRNFGIVSTFIPRGMSIP